MKSISQLILEEEKNPVAIEEKAAAKIRKLEEENKRLKMVKSDGVEKAIRGIMLLMFSLAPAGIVLGASYAATKSFDGGLQVTGVFALMGIAGYILMKTRLEDIE